MSDEEESDALGTVDEREYDVLSAVGLDRLRAKLGTRAPLSITRDRFSNSLAPAQPRPYHHPRPPTDPTTPTRAYRRCPRPRRAHGRFAMAENGAGSTPAACAGGSPDATARRRWGARG
jgi:hypothetical protein